MTCVASTAPKSIIVCSAYRIQHRHRAWKTELRIFEVRQFSSGMDISITRGPPHHNQTLLGCKPRHHSATVVLEQKRPAQCAQRTHAPIKFSDTHITSSNSLETWSPSNPISNACHSFSRVARGSNTNAPSDGGGSSYYLKSISLRSSHRETVYATMERPEHARCPATMATRLGI